MCVVCLAACHADPNAVAAAAAVAVAEGDEWAEGGGDAGQPHGEVLGPEHEGGRRGRAERWKERDRINFYYIEHMHSIRLIVPRFCPPEIEILTHNQFLHFSSLQTSISLIAFLEATNISINQSRMPNMPIKNAKHQPQVKYY